MYIKGVALVMKCIVRKFSKKSEVRLYNLLILLQKVF